MLSCVAIDFGEAENSMSNYNLSSTCFLSSFLPFSEHSLSLSVDRICEDDVSGQSSLGSEVIPVELFICCKGSILVNYLMETGYHPEQIAHSVTALFINCMSVIPPGMWDDDIRKLVQDIIVEISTHTSDYSDNEVVESRLVRTTTVHPSGFCVISTEHDIVDGVYYATRENFCDLPIFRSENDCALYRQVCSRESMKSRSIMGRVLGFYVIKMIPLSTISILQILFLLAFLGSFLLEIIRTVCMCMCVYAVELIVQAISDII